MAKGTPGRPGGTSGGPPSRTITGDSGDNLLQGTSGPNTIVGLGGNDTIIGGAAYDTLTGDTLGGDGSAGADTFVYRRTGEAPPGEEPGNEGVERITDFNPSVDKIDLTGIRGFTDFTGTTPNIDAPTGNVWAEQHGADTWLVADTDGILSTNGVPDYDFLVVLEGVDASALNDSNVLVTSREGEGVVLSSPPGLANYNPPGWLF